MQGANDIANKRDTTSPSNGWGGLFSRSAEYVGRDMAAKKKVQERLAETEYDLMAAGKNKKGMRVKTAPNQEELMNSWSMVLPKRMSSTRSISTEKDAVNMLSQHKAALRDSSLC
mmetsp:Transcript_56015/g.167701  ORF Transcript_56015/g.167701 Transcript_56015/m.167701 type:complete len:115 (-) Transcript_56015:193-537(-)